MDKKDLNKNSSNNSNNSGNNKEQTKKVLTFLLVSLFLTFAFNMFSSSMFKRQNLEITYDTFVEMVESDFISEVEIQYDRLIIIPKDEKRQEIRDEFLNENFLTIDYLDTKRITESSSFENVLPESFSEKAKESSYSNIGNFYTGRLVDTNLLNILNENDVTHYTRVINNNKILSFITEWVLPMVFLYGIILLLMYFVSKRMKGIGPGKNKAKMYKKEDATKISFDDVAGQEEAKDSLKEIVDFLHNPEKYKEIGATQPKGALLVGPPGTGKTLLAKAVAGESNATFLSISGSEFVELYVGVGASRVRDLFSDAKKNSPCIIFIDEIDAIGKSRDAQYGGNDEREQTLNQLLAEMDGFDSNSAIVVLAATNRPEVLDKALLRPGRFDREVIVEIPDLKGRQDILKVHLKKVKCSSDINVKNVGLATTGLSGADLANIVNEAALLAVRSSRKEVSHKDLIKAVEVIVGGKEKKENHISIKERKVIAYHEIGHALTSALQDNTTPIQRITIVPRTNGVLGFAWYTEKKEKVIRTKDELFESIVVSLGGRAAEVVGLGIETTGSSNDIEHATATARRMVTMFGMSDKFKMMGIETVQSRYLNGRSSSNCSDITLAEVDSEVNLIIDRAFEKSKSLLTEYKEALDELSNYLLEHENIDGIDFMKLLKKYKPELKIEEENPQITLEDIQHKDKKEEESPEVIIETSTVNTTIKYNPENSKVENDKSHIDEKDIKSNDEE